MDQIISQETMVEILQLGSQYAVPVAALLRALYEGVRGRMPEGFFQIAIASFFAGLTSILDSTGEGVTFVDILAEIFSNTVFMVGLLSFILVYLLRQPDRGRWVDGIVGAVLGLLSWLAWVYVLRNDWPIWTAPLAVMAGAASFIALRFALRQIVKVVRITTYLIVGGVVLMILGAGAWLLITLASQPTPVG